VLDKTEVLPKPQRGKSTGSVLSALDLPGSFPGASVRMMMNLLSNRDRGVHGSTDMEIGASLP
jgi:hypothetical protein